MGPPPPPPSSRPSFFSANSSLPAADEWFFTNSDRDTQLLTQALTRELSTPSSSSSHLRDQTLISASLQENLDFDRQYWSESLHLVRALQQQQKQQRQEQMQQTAGVAMAAAATRMAMSYSLQHQEDSFNSSLTQRGSPPSSNSQSPLCASNPGSPYSNSTITRTNSAMSMAPLVHQNAHEGLLAGPAMVSHNASSCNSLHSSRTASMALSSQASLGAAGNKVSKRRSRASNRAPISVLLADVSNFRAMVQQLTGIPSSTPSIHSLYGNSSLLKPHPSKHQYTEAPSLPTLDTSACFLGPKPIMKEPLQGFTSTKRGNRPSSSLSPGAGNESGSRQGWNVEGLRPGFHRTDVPLHGKQSVYGDKASVSSSSSILTGTWDYADTAKTREDFASAIESHPFSTKKPTGFQELQDYLPTKSQYSSAGGESWLSFDGLLVGNHAANSTELARMA